MPYRKFGGGRDGHPRHGGPAGQLVRSQLTLAEKTGLLRDHPVDFTWCLSNVDGPVVIYGVEVVFESGAAYRLILIPGEQ